jgi:hypothetical protein
MKQLNNRVTTLNKARKNILERRASAVSNCTNEDWHIVLEAAQDAGALPLDLYYRDIIAFNRDAASFNGTITEFIKSRTGAA